MSNSSYEYRGDLYSVQNSPLKRKLAPPPPKKEVKSIVESSRLALIAKGGKWVIFGVIYPFYFLFYVIPQGIFTHIVPKITCFCYKVSTFILSPLRKLARMADLARRRVAAFFQQLVIQPYKWVSNQIKKIGNKCKSLKGFKLKIVNPFKFSFNLKKFRKFSIKPFKFPTFRPFTLPKIKWRLPRIKVRITLPNLHLASKWQTLKKRLTPRINLNLKWPKINIKLPSLPKFKFKFPSVRLKIPKLSFSIKIPKWNFNWKIPAINIKFPKIDLKRLLSPLKNFHFDPFKKIKPLIHKIYGVFHSLFSYLNRGLNVISRIVKVIANGLSLLFHYWAEQVKEKFNR